MSTAKNARKFVTTGVGFSFVIVATTGFIFKFIFKNHTLEEIHGWVGMVMLVAALFHIVQHWRELAIHLRDKRVYALVVPLAVLCVMLVTEQRGQERGPIGRRVVKKLTRATIADVANVLGKDGTRVVAAMRSDGLDATVNDTLEQIATRAREPEDRVLSYFVE